MKIYLGNDYVGEAGRFGPPRGTLTDRGDYQYGALPVTTPRNSTVVVKLCETERRRQALSLPRLKTMLATLGDQPPEGPLPGGDTERLPVVELRPFTQKEWRPAKSLAPQMPSDRSPTSLSNPVPLKKAMSEYEAWGYIDPDKTLYTVSPRAMDAPCPRAFSVAGDRMSSHPKSRETTGVYSTSVSTPAPGFVPKLERERSTAEDIRCGTSQSAYFSGLKSSLGEADLRHQQTMQVHGTGLENPPRSSGMYVKPWECYNMPRPYQAASRENLPTEDHHPGMVENLYMKLEQIQNTYLDENIYDAFDRSQTLPSINVNKANMKKRKKDARLSAGKMSSRHAHRLGVTNSLDLLSHYGTPIGVEQQLTKQLKHTLNHIRRSKPLAISGMKGIKNYEWSPTQGEQQISSGRKANTATTTSSSGRSHTRTMSSRGNRAGGTQGWMSRATTYIDSGVESIADGVKSPIKNMDVRRSKLHSIRGSAIKSVTPEDGSRPLSQATSGHACNQVGSAGDQGGPKNTDVNKDRMSIISEKDGTNSDASKIVRSESKKRLVAEQDDTDDRNTNKLDEQIQEENEEDENAHVTIPSQGEWAQEDQERNSTVHDNDESNKQGVPEERDHQKGNNNQQAVNGAIGNAQQEISDSELVEADKIVGASTGETEDQQKAQSDGEQGEQEVSQTLINDTTATAEEQQATDGEVPNSSQGNGNIDSKIETGLDDNNSHQHQVLQDSVDTGPDDNSSNQPPVLEDNVDTSDTESESVCSEGHQQEDQTETQEPEPDQEQEETAPPAEVAF